VSFKSCVSTVGKSLDESDIDSIKELAQPLIEDGMAVNEAYIAASRQLTSSLLNERKDYGDQIKKQGGELPSRAVTAEASFAEREDVGTTETKVDSEAEYTPSQKAAIEKIFATKDSKISQVKKKVENMKYRTKTKLRQGIVDQYSSIKDILGNERAWMLSHLTSAHNGVIEGVIEGGSPVFVDGVVQIDTESKSLNEILAPLGADMDRFTYWMAAGRAEILKGKGKEHLFTDAEIVDLKKLDGGREKLFNSVRKDFEAMNDSFNRIAVETGVFSKEEADMFKEEGFYLPFYRVLDEEVNARGPRTPGDAGLVRQKAYKKIKGGEQQLDDMIGNAVLNWNHIVSASLKNQAAVESIKTAEEMGIARQVPVDDKSKDAIFVKKDGQEVWYEIEGPDAPLIMDSLMSLNFNGLNTISMKIGRAFKRAVTIGVTVNPEFKIANLMRDTIQAIAVADMSTNIAKNLVEGYKATERKGDVHFQMLSGGATFGDSGYIHGADPEAIKHIVKKGIERDTVLDSRLRVKKMFDKYQDWGARAENVNRAANYTQALKKGKDLVTANFEAKDHLDFSRTGTFMAIRIMAQTIPFLNARLQGLDKIGRAGFDVKQRKQLLAVIGTYSLASVGMYLAMKDDEDYKATEQWERDTYHLFKLPGSETMYRFPRPFEVGVMATMAERMAEQMVDDEAHGELFAERLGHAITETFGFNPLSVAAIKPALEIAQDESWFTKRPIEGRSLEGLSKTQRKKAWTSQTGIALSNAMDSISWGKVVLSPVQIDHLVQGYLGWAGSTMLAAVDTIVEPLIDAPVAPAKRITEYPVIKKFAKSGPPGSTKYTTEFYKRLNEVNTVVNDIRNFKSLKDIDSARALAKKERSKLKFRKVFGKARKTLSKVNKAMLRVRSSKTMTRQEKQVEMDRLKIHKNNITKRVTEMSNEAF